MSVTPKPHNQPMDRRRYRIVWLFGTPLAGASAECLDCPSWMTLADDIDQAWRHAARHEQEAHRA